MEQEPEFFYGVLYGGTTDQHAMVRLEIHQGTVQRRVISLQAMSLIHC